MATGVLAYISQILQSGKNLIFTDGEDRLPPSVEATLATALKVGVKGGVAKLNPEGLPVDIAGNPSAVVGVGEGKAADQAAVAQLLADRPTLAAVQELLSGVTAAVPAGTVVVRRYSSATAIPVRGSVATAAVVQWIGPVQPPLGGGYALAGDIYTATAA